MVPHLALTERWIQQRGNGSGQGASVVSHAKLPGVVQEDGYHLARFGPARRESTSNIFDKLSIFRVANTAIA